jgi:hypothetical protein
MRAATTSFSGGSDHYIFSDPTVGVPMPMFIQWPDKFYHTSADTLDKVDPISLARVGTLAAAYAYFVASAGPAETTWLAYEMAARFQMRLARQAQNDLNAIWAAGTPAAVHQTLAQAERRLTYALDRHRAALSTLGRLSPDVELDPLYQEAADFEQQRRNRLQQIAATRLQTGGATEAERVTAAEPNEWEQKAATLIPRRLYRGPGSTIGGMSSLSPAERTAWFNRTRNRPGSHTLPSLAEYWADGRRTAAEILDLVELETGLRDAELIIGWFELLHRLGLVSYESA